VLTGIGPVSVQVPKVRSRTEESAVFHSSLVPPYVRKTKSVEAALPWLYLRGWPPARCRRRSRCCWARRRQGFPDRWSAG
jgi:hypothetical protein